jgi:hypothetical protein
VDKKPYLAVEFFLATDCAVLSSGLTHQVTPLPARIDRSGFRRGLEARRRLAESEREAWGPAPQWAEPRCRGLVQKKESKPARTVRRASSVQCGDKGGFAIVLDRYPPIRWIRPERVCPGSVCEKN